MERVLDVVADVEEAAVEVAAAGVVS